MNQTIYVTPENIWKHAYFHKLNLKGKLALSFLVFSELDSVIIEDMAIYTGLDISECKDWINQFNADQVLYDYVEVL